jgi:hypothetical protein
VSGNYLGAAFEALSGELHARDAIFDRCSFDNCNARGGVVENVVASDCETWACSLHNVELRDCTVTNLRTSVGGGGGKRSPLFLWGVLAHHLTLRGRIGGLIWNPPRTSSDSASADISAARRFYAGVQDWALDVSEARFTSVPSLAFAPPGGLVRRDPETQPLVTRDGAARVLRRLPVATSVWTVVLDEFVRSPWPDETVLVPALGARKEQRDRDRRELERLGQLGAFEP